MLVSVIQDSREGGLVSLRVARKRLRIILTHHEPNTEACRIMFRMLSGAELVDWAHQREGPQAIRTGNKTRTRSALPPSGTGYRST